MDMASPIGVLDSGLGGVSVLRALVALLPNENYIYFGDSANAPYGERTEYDILQLSVKATEHLVTQGVKAVVIGCNTITGVAAQFLRERFPHLIIVATEPAVKPAVRTKKNGVFIVMATPATLAGQRFNEKAKLYEGQATIVKCPCPGLMEFVERGEIDSDALRDYLTKRFASLGMGDVQPDGVVLGCTHYPFVRATIQEILGDHVQIFDGASAIARQVQRKLNEANLLNTGEVQGTILWQNSSPDPAMITRGKMLLALP